MKILLIENAEINSKLYAFFFLIEKRFEPFFIFLIAYDGLSSGIIPICVYEFENVGGTRRIWEFRS